MSEKATDNDEKAQQRGGKLRQRSALPARSDKYKSEVDRWELYKEFPLLQSLLEFESLRTSRLQIEGRKQIESIKSNEGWIKTLFVLNGRALDRSIFPGMVTMIHAVIYTIIQEVVYDGVDNSEVESWEFFFGLVLNSTLSFLLVFRLQRAASRFWDARALWGMIVARGRCFVGSVVAHADHSIAKRDDTIRWLVAFAIATMELLRGTKIPPEILAGLLSQAEVEFLNSNVHPPIAACDMVRMHVHKLFSVQADTPLSVAHLWVRHLNSLEQHLNVMLEACGGLERIRGTPLPLVYVTHLRTFLMIALLLFPYIWGPSLGWPRFHS